MKQNLIDKYALMLVKKGLNLQPGQTLVLQSSPDGSALAQAVTKAAFEAGAKDVIVHYEDPYITRLRAQYCDLETLRKVEDWQKESLDLYLRNDGVQLGLMATMPKLMEGISDERASIVNEAKNELRNVIRAYIHKGQIQWTGTALPNIEWAREVYPHLSDEEALEKLEEAVLKMVRVGEDNDPLADWDKHIAHLQTRSKKLNEYHFKSLHITSELGTDISMDLPEGHLWTSAGELNEKNGVMYVANVPTEEIFTDPHKYTVHGKAVASRPLSINGKLVEEFGIIFENGKAVDCFAKKNVEALKDVLFKDEHSCYLGEVALVSKQSPITQMNTVFYNGLVDENAASHLAFGASFPTCIKGGSKMSVEELDAHGVNSAKNHNDFMIGTPEFKVVGTTYDGEEIVVMEHGDFVF